MVSDARELCPGKPPLRPPQSWLAEPMESPRDDAEPQMPKVAPPNVNSKGSGWVQEGSFKTAPSERSSWGAGIVLLTVGPRQRSCPNPRDAREDQDQPFRSGCGPDKMLGVSAPLQKDTGSQSAFSPLEQGPLHRVDFRFATAKCRATGRAHVTTHLLQGGH